MHFAQVSFSVHFLQKFSHLTIIKASTDITSVIDFCFRELKGTKSSEGKYDP